MLPLCCLDLPRAVTNKLLDAGFVFLEDVFLVQNEYHPDLEKFKNLKINLKNVIKDSIKIPRKTSAASLLEMEQNTSKVLTFSYKLDKIFGGGVPLGVLTEVCGAPGSGKTQLCLQLCVSVQLHASLGGIQAEAVYIDTDGGFSPLRLQEIAKGCREHCCKVARTHNFSKDIVQILENEKFENYYYVPAYDCSKLLGSVSDLESFIQSHNKIKLIIVDSLSFSFLQINDLLKRTALLCKILKQLKILASSHGISVVITNHLTTRICRGNDQLTPALGESVGYLMDQRLILGVLPKVGNFGGVLFKSPVLPNNSAEFQISSIGVRDIL